MVYSLETIRIPDGAVGAVGAASSVTLTGICTILRPSGVIVLRYPAV
jgi:hypothetical protein